MFNSKDNSASNTNARPNTNNSSSKLDTMLGSNTTINGDINFNGKLVLDGRIVGSLKGTQNDDALIVSESGLIEGKVEVANIVINGQIKGDITASGKIEVLSKAQIEGNVYYHNIEMEAGSKINGQLIYQEEDKVGSAQKKEEKKSKK